MTTAQSVSKKKDESIYRFGHVSKDIPRTARHCQQASSNLADSNCPTTLHSRFSCQVIMDHGRTFREASAVSVSYAGRFAVESKEGYQMTI